MKSISQGITKTFDPEVLNTFPATLRAVIARVAVQLPSLLTSDEQEFCILLPGYRKGG
jgi:hypothetical protein